MKEIGEFFNLFIAFLFISSFLILGGGTYSADIGGGMHFLNNSGFYTFTFEANPAPILVSNMKDICGSLNYF